MTKKLKNELVTKGRSQAEEQIIALIRLKFPGIKIERNDKSILGRQEIDIHLIDYKIAIEVDGITHFKPIYGEKRFQESLERDARKEARLKELGFTLFRIDISTLTNATMYSFLKKYVNETLIPQIKLIAEGVKC